jgi:hypothetical protein
MEHFGDHQGREEKRSAARSESRNPSSRSRPARTRETGSSRLKRRHRSKSSHRLHVNKKAKASGGPARDEFGGDLPQELRSLIPQPSLDGPKDEPCQPQEPGEEPAPPSASAGCRRPEGNDDDLFEYVF